VNVRPHLGTLTQLLSADVYSRYLRLKGEDVVFVSGSDEHGAPIEVEALKRKVTPRQLANTNHKLIKRLLKAYNIQFDNYTRTESPVHKQFVQDFYRRVDHNGYVHVENVVLPFCENDQRFLPDRFVEGECPHCHHPGARGDQCDNCGRILEPTDLINPYCVLCRQKPVLRESKHWFFDLPKLASRLQQYVEGNTNFPENARNFSLSWIKEGLQPRSLTRDISWGIPAPFKGAEGKTLYVWMEAVLGYVSATQEWSKKKGQPSLWKKYWLSPASRNIHFIGKDNIIFHTIIFPGLLEASKQAFCLPWQVSSTEYVNFEGSKFSKSKKIGVWMDEALELEASEYWRYALTSLRPEQKDVNFTWEEFERKINTELNDVLGNFVHRTLSFLQTHFGGVVPKYTSKHEGYEKMLQVLKIESMAIDSSLQHFRIKEALERVVELGRQGNRYLNGSEPWKVYKQSHENAGQVIGISVQLAGNVAILLQPFLPLTSSRVLQVLAKKRSLSWKKSGTYFVKPGTRIPKLEPLFHKVSAVDLRDRLAELRSTETPEAEV
jgi:methionyl-tRNA synthetase